MESIVSRWSRCAARTSWWISSSFWWPGKAGTEDAAHRATGQLARALGDDVLPGAGPARARAIRGSRGLRRRDARRSRAALSLRVHLLPRAPRRADADRRGPGGVLRPRPCGVAAPLRLDARGGVSRSAATQSLLAAPRPHFRRPRSLPRRARAG